MNVGIRTRVFLVILGLTALVGLIAGVLLEVRLRNDLVDGIEDRLSRDAATLSVHLERQGWADIDDEVDAIAAPAGTRLTVIDEAGRVLGDSERDGADLQNMDNHAARPEVRDAFARGVGTAQRKSQTIDAQMLYVARRVDGPRGNPTVLRAATPLSKVSSAEWTLRLNLLVGLGLALVVGIGSAALISRWMQATLERLVSRADALAVEREDDDIDETDLLPAPQRGSVQALSDRLEGALHDLAGERDRREAVLKGVTDAVFAVDSDLIITLANPAARALLGPKPVGQALGDLSASRKLVKLARSAMKKKKPKLKEIPWEGPPRRELEAVIAPLPGQEGAVIVVHDLTEVRALERVRTDFVTNVSHELRTPVAIIAANAETLVDGAINDPEFAADFVDAVHRHALRLSSLVDDLLSLSRIESGRLPLDLRALNVRDLAAQIAHTATELRGSKHPVEVDVPTDLEVWADRSALEHALGNLTENAVKYAREARILIRAGEDEERVWIEVADEGPGIAEEHLDRIFERFYRVDGGRTRDVGGTGLGLSIVRHLTETLGGTVEARTNEPTGVVFRLDLPGPSDAD